MCYKVNLFNGWLTTESFKHTAFLVHMLSLYISGCISCSHIIVYFRMRQNTYDLLSKVYNVANYLRFTAQAFQCYYMMNIASFTKEINFVIIQ